MNKNFRKAGKRSAQSSTRPHTLKKFGVAMAGLALALGASAQAFHSVAREIRPLPAGTALLLGPSSPNDTVYFNVIHAYGQRVHD